MGGNANVPHNALGLGFQQGFHGAAGGQDFIQVFRAGVVELVQVNVIGAQVFQAGGKLGFHLCLGQRTALGGKDKFIPQAQFLQRLANPLLADGVSAGGINVIDARLMRGFQHGSGARFINALHRNAAKAQARNPQPGAAKINILHISFSLFAAGVPCPAWTVVQSITIIAGKALLVTFFGSFLLTLHLLCVRIRLFIGYLLVHYKGYTRYSRGRKFLCVMVLSAAATWAVRLPAQCAAALGRKMLCWPTAPRPRLKPWPKHLAAAPPPTMWSRRTAM